MGRDVRGWLALLLGFSISDIVVIVIFYLIKNGLKLNVNIW